MRTAKNGLPIVLALAAVKMLARLAVASRYGIFRDEPARSTWTVGLRGPPCRGIPLAELCPKLKRWD